MSRAAGLVAILFVLAGCGEEDVNGPVPAPPAFVATGIDLAASTAGENCVAWGDSDRDGRMDVMVCGPAGTFLNLSYGGGFFFRAPGLPNALDASLAWGDYDGDGRLDVFVAGHRIGASDVAQVWHHEGGWGWEFAKLVPDLMVPGTWGQAASWGDYDNDGDLDIAMVGWRESLGKDAWLFLNNGGVGFSEGAFAVEGVSSGGIASGDCDNDGDLDLAVAGSALSGVTAGVYTNEDGSFTDAGSSLTAVTSSSVAWGDYDNDGDLDLAVIGNSTGPTGLGVIATIYENDGSGGYTDIGAGLLGALDGSVSWGDYDNDGDLDLLVGGQTDVYRNDGGGTFTRLAIDFLGPGGPGGGTQAAWGDYDGDGDLDIATSVPGPPFTVKCTIYRNTVDAPNDPPDPPAGLAAIVTGAGPVYDVAFGWDPSIDDNTPTPGLTYNLRVVEDSSGIELMPGMSIVGGANDGKRLLPAMGNVQHAGPPAAARRSWTLHLPAGTYRWSVQAVDTAFAASTWPAEVTVDVPPP